jgi:two-component system NtrC family response regulator
MRLPALRERTGDIHLLAQAFLKKFGTEGNKARIKFAPGAIGAMEKYPWPGNVRELENRVRRAVIMSEGMQVTATDLELQEVEAAAASEPRTLKEAREAVERDLIQGALRRHNGKIAPAAAELGISRPTFYELMEKLGIQKEKESESEA